MLKSLWFTLASLVFGHSAAQNEIIRQVQDIMGAAGAKAIGTVIEHGQNPPAYSMIGDHVVGRGIRALQ